MFSRNGWKVLEIGQLECVSHGVVCGVFHCIDSEKVLISVDDRQEREVHVGLRRLVVETHPGRFQIFFFYLIYAHRSNCFVLLMSLFIECII